MAHSDEDPQQGQRDYAQLQRLHDRMVAQLESMRDEIQAPETKRLLRDVRARIGGTQEDLAVDVASELEEAIRAVKLAQAELEQSWADEVEEISDEVVAKLPAALRRFLAERSGENGFTYELVQDEVRGWVIRWKEYTHRGTVRGYGQYYERPYAWLEE